MRRIYTLIVFCWIVLNSQTLFGAPNVVAYSVDVDSQLLCNRNAMFFDSLVQKATHHSGRKLVYTIIHPVIRANYTPDFYLLMLLCLMLGLIRSLYPKFFADLWRSFTNPTLGDRQLKDVIQSAAFPNLLMNLYSSIIIGLFTYYLISMNIDWRFATVPRGLMVGLMVLGAVLVYAGKFLFVQMAAWAFNQKASGAQYNYNIFLVNKILSIALLPLVVFFAFGPKEISPYLAVFSFVLLLLSYTYRYVRSWGIFAQIFQNSRFHFFMYLCAFEILPMAVLIKTVKMLL